MALVATGGRCFSFVLAATLLVLGCDDEPASSTGLPRPGVDTLQGDPWLTLPPGNRYFETGGRSAPIILRNVTAGTVARFDPLFAAARAAGTNVVRLQLTQGFGYQTLGIEANGAVREDWARSWESVIDAAAEAGLAVIPVFGIWGDWNDGTPDLGWTHFDANPLNRANGGPAATPAELFAESETQRLWLEWLSTLVERWNPRQNVIAWEIFSELDLATGATEENATAFAERATDVIRTKDSATRPVLASTSDLPLIGGKPWTQLWASRANDLVSLHVYDKDLDRVAVQRVRSVLALTDKPVFLGESGLSAAAPDGTTLTSAPRAPVGLRNAIWAELFSGAANARGLYWEDGYALYYPASGSPLVDAMNDLERPAVEWLANRDFVGVQPLQVTATGALFGVALGTADHVLGWLRNDLLRAPTWDAASLSDASAEVAVPGAPDGTWVVTLTSVDGAPLGDVVGTSVGESLRFDVPGPFDAAAFEARP
jgi:hypothetical protein